MIETIQIFINGQGYWSWLPYMDENLKKTIKTLGLLSTIGMSMALSITLGGLIGYYIDLKFGSQPWFLIVFLGLGIAAAFKNLHILYKKAKKL